MILDFRIIILGFVFYIIFSVNFKFSVYICIAWKGCPRNDLLCFEWNVQSLLTTANY